MNITIVFMKHFSKKIKIREIEVHTELAKDVKLDEVKFKDALLSRKYSTIRLQALEHANTKANISGVPTFIIGEERINGVVDKETFKKQ